MKTRQIFKNRKISHYNTSNIIKKSIFSVFLQEEATTAAAKGDINLERPEVTFYLSNIVSRSSTREALFWPIAAFQLPPAPR